MSRWRVGRAGAMPGTPTPAPRFQDTFQLKEGAESEGVNTDFYDSGNDSQSIPIFSYDKPDFIELYKLHETSERREVLFQVQVLLRPGNDGQDLPVWATVDSGAMLCVLERTYWVDVEARLGPLAKSNVICRMANGHCKKSAGCGTAHLGVAGLWFQIQFEVLESRGAFEILLGKPWLRDSGAVQIFNGDRLTILGPQGPIELQNEHPSLDRATRVKATAEPVEDPAPEKSSGREAAPKQSQVQEENPGEPAPICHSRRLAKLPPSNPFWVDGHALEMMKQWLGMETKVDEGEAEATPVMALEKHKLVVK
ncbi:Retrovirus-related Pol polyprotein from transposon opus [Ceratobasidium sp. AG-Ba]|nr:Retrovirus-related Pol polyprotein from transposon opus [Ceratobasidium sp. AG-Ba]